MAADEATLNAEVAKALSAVPATSAESETPNDAEASRQAEEPQRPEYLSTVTDQDWAALTPEARTQLVTLGKTLSRGYTKKFEDLAKQRKALEPLAQLKEHLEANPDKLSYLQQALQDYEARGGKPAGARTEQAVSDTGDLIDELKRADDPQVREQAQKLEEAITRRLKATGVDAGLRQELSDIRRTLKDVLGTSARTRQQAIEGELTKLPTSYTPLLEKYREEVMANAVKYPTLPLKRILMLTVEPEEYDEAVKGASAESSQSHASRVKSAGTNAPATTQAGTASLVTDTDYRPSPRPHMYGKQVDIGKVLAKLVPDALKSMPK